MIKVIWTLLTGNWIVQYVLIVGLVWGVYKTNNYFVGQAAIEKSIQAAKDKNAKENIILKERELALVEKTKSENNSTENEVEQEVDRIKKLPIKHCLDVKLSDLGLR